MTLEQAEAWLCKLADDFLTFNSDVEWRAGAGKALINLIEQEAAKRIAELEAVLRAIKADCESTDPDDLPEQRKLVNRIYADVCKLTK